MDFLKSNKKNVLNQGKKGPDNVSIIFDSIVTHTVTTCCAGFVHLSRLVLSRYSIIVLPTVLVYAAISWIFSTNKGLLKAITWIDPHLQLNKYWQYIYFEIDLKWHVLVTLSILASFPLYILGIRYQWLKDKYLKMFTSVGLTNSLGEIPTTVHVSRRKEGKRTLIFDSNGIALKRFIDSQQQMEGFFETNIESITIGTRPNYIEIVLTDQLFPQSVKYEDMKRRNHLSRYSFFLGESTQGAESQLLPELPHLLIAGTTGSGKSVFFKQALMGLLESSPHLQMYLIDLKGGLEMVDFAICPNVKVIKDMREAVTHLHLVKKEMMKRFSYLESCGRKQIIPESDKKDRIIVAVDEASVLYMTRPRNDPEYDLAVEARTLADTIAKLARASAIHLLFATQKLDKQVIPTSVSENISGKMAFRANSVQGSLVVLGNKNAMELPQIPGRGIFKFGQREVIVQTPFITDKIIIDRCKSLKRDFESGVRSTFGQMITEQVDPEIQHLRSLALQHNKDKKGDSHDD